MGLNLKVFFSDELVQSGVERGTSGTERRPNSTEKIKTKPFEFQTHFLNVFLAKEKPLWVRYELKILAKKTGPLERGEFGGRLNWKDY